MSFELGIENGSLWLDHRWQRVNLYIRGGRIAALTSETLPADRVENASGKKIIPGCIDSHVHLAMPAGKFTSADDFYSGSVCAAFGGVTTYIDFLDEKSTAEEIRSNFTEREGMARAGVVDYSFHASICQPIDPPRAIADVTKSLGLATIKAYTTYKEGGMYTDEGYLADLLSITAEGGLMLMVHSERDELLRKEQNALSQQSTRRPPLSEIAQVLSLASLTEQTGGRCYIVHVSCGSTVALLAEKYANILGKRFFVESCPHYFLFDDSRYTGPEAARFSMTPPLRPAAERERLIAQIGNIHTIGTDHCPFLRAEKEAAKIIPDLPMGAGGLGHAFQSLYGLFGDAMIDKFTENQARIHGLYPQKGVIQVGSDADLVIFDEQPCVPEERSKGDWSLYTGREEPITIRSVLSRGAFVVKEGALKAHQGQFVEQHIE